MIKISGLIFALLLLTGPVFSQEYFYQKLDKRSEKLPDSAGYGEITIHKDSRVDSIVALHKRYNRHVEGIDGYRIQIFFDAGNNSLSRAEQVVEDFRTLYPIDSAYISFSEPYYKVRIGDFRSRLKAEAYLQQVLKDYPNAFVIRDRINLPPLN